MSDHDLLPRRVFLRLATGSGIALAATVLAACELSRPAPPPSGRPATPATSGPPSTTPGPPSASVAPSSTGLPPSPPPPSTSPSASPSPSANPGPTATPGPTVVGENRREGARGWARGLGSPSSVELFASPSSVEPGEVVSLHVACPVPYAVEWYRIGWYRGAGARLIHAERRRPASPRGPVFVNRMTGLVEARWDVAVSATVTGDWRSGLYVAVVRPADGSAPGAAPFIVRAPLRSSAPAVFVSAQATWQAYNAWGGRSLYSYNSSGLPTTSGTRAAAVVSMDRPYDADGGLGYLRKWEIQFIRWLERSGREVDYLLDLDLETRPETLAERRLAILAGHAEYWSGQMRDAMERAVAAGMNAAFFSANEIYWQVRLGPTDLGPGRRITCYKSAVRDPMRLIKPHQTTCRWREAPVLRPEARFLGVMYGHVVHRPADWVVADARHWVYDGTGLLDGDHLVNLVGQEYDAYFADLAPAGTEVIARSPVAFVGRDPDQFGNVESPAMHSAAVRDPAGGAGGVFAAGTFQWSWALDAYAQHVYNGRQTPLDPRVERITSNVLDRFSS